MRVFASRMSTGILLKCCPSGVRASSLSSAPSTCARTPSQLNLLCRSTLPQPFWQRAMLRLRTCTDVNTEGHEEVSSGETCLQDKTCRTVQTFRDCTAAAIALSAGGERRRLRAC